MKDIATRGPADAVLAEAGQLGKPSGPAKAFRTALVTGASRGIGAAIARQLAQRGCRVAVHYVQNRVAADAVVAALPPADSSGAHRAFTADLADAREAELLWQQVTADFGAIDVLVNNAGRYEEHPPLAASYSNWQDAWRSTLDVNLIGPANLSFLAARDMAARRQGRMVNVSSRGAFRGEPTAPAYGASKAGLNSFSQSLALALAPHGVQVYCVAPGWVDTDMARAYIDGPRGRDLLAQHPLGRIATAAEVAEAVTFCALDAPAAMTGCIIDVNGASYLRT